MAQVKIKNTRDHEIHLNLPHKAAVVIPASKEVEGKKVPGVALVDTEVLEQLEDNPVVKHYFSEGWLEEVKAPQPKQQKDKEDKDKK